MKSQFKLMTAFGFVCLLASLVTGATFTVTKTADTNDGTCDADCSLREAVVAANASTANDVIEFSSLFAAPQTITLGGTDLIITNAGTLSINGPGATLLTVSGNNTSRVFTNNTGAVTVISGLTVTGGNGSSTVTTGRGGGVYNNGGNLTLNFVIVRNNNAANGGGANNAGTATFTINNSLFVANQATGSGGALQNFSGNTMNITNSLFLNNICNSTSTGGGAIQANGTLTIANSTFVGNAAVGGSGAIFYNGTLLTMVNATLTGNNSTNNGGGIHKSTTNPLNIRNTIIAGNGGVGTSPDVTGIFQSQGRNIIGNVGTATGWVGTDLPNTDPLLGPLGDNGGFTQTRVPQLGSPAINAGDNCVIDATCATGNLTFNLTTDQRGVTRSASPGVDIGAVEVALPVRIAGRVRGALRPIGGALVTVTTGSTVVGTARTTTFGNFEISGLTPGTTYTVAVTSRSATFITQVLNPSADVLNLTFTAINEN